MTAGIVDFDALVSLSRGEDAEPNAATAGVWEYLQQVREDSAFETGLLPLGEGIAVSVRIE
jgi:predicted O-methyltransferase YrrM